MKATSTAEKTSRGVWRWTCFSSLNVKFFVSVGIKTHTGKGNLNQWTNLFKYFFQFPRDRNRLQFPKAVRKVNSMAWILGVNFAGNTCTFEAVKWCKNFSSYNFLLFKLKVNLNLASDLFQFVFSFKLCSEKVWLTSKFYLHHASVNVTFLRHQIRPSFFGWQHPVHCTCSLILREHSPLLHPSFREYPAAISFSYMSHIASRICLPDLELSSLPPISQKASVVARFLSPNFTIS